ncbi:MAG TPA: nucleotidyltransferase family protein, partial [Pseudomonas sp.]|nr:nucleotidyltransferase family protein [Pseudomonas sp.]
MSTTRNEQPCAVAGLVLAAGVSRRFGADKRQAALADGRSLLAASLALPCAVLDEVLVVLRGDDDPAGMALPAAARWLTCEQSALGMGHSLAAGVRHLDEVSRADAVAVFLGDMPWLNEASLRALLAEASPDRIVLPVFEGQRGHPVIFGRRFWPELMQLTGDSGARQVLMAHPQAHRSVVLDDPGLV